MWEKGSEYFPNALDIEKETFEQTTLGQAIFFLVGDSPNIQNEM
jgi:hypothetical protein